MSKVIGIFLRKKYLSISITLYFIPFKRNPDVEFIDISDLDLINFINSYNNNYKHVFN